MEKDFDWRYSRIVQVMARSDWNKWLDYRVRTKNSGARPTVKSPRCLVIKVAAVNQEDEIY